LSDEKCRQLIEMVARGWTVTFEPALDVSAMTVRAHAKNPAHGAEETDW